LANTIGLSKLPDKGRRTHSYMYQIAQSRPLVRVFTFIPIYYKVPGLREGETGAEAPLEEAPAFPEPSGRANDPPLVDEESDNGSAEAQPRGHQ
jgi:hypothetical protein